jgi:hypothetical protein
MQKWFIYTLCTCSILNAACAVGRNEDSSTQTANSGTTVGKTSDVGTAAGGNPAGGGTLAGGALTSGTTTSAGDNTGLQPIANTPAAYTAVGRFVQQSGNALSFVLPTSRLGGSFSGTSLGVQMGDPNYDYFDVILDGNIIVSPNVAQNAPCLPLAAAQAINPNVDAYTGCFGTAASTTPRTFVVANNLAPGQHTAWLIKRTEFYQGSGTNGVGRPTFYGFVLDADATMLTPPARRDRRIDFIGDSAFTGYGAGHRMRDASDTCDFIASQQEAAASVPYYTGELLHADITNASASGQGVVHSTYDPTAAHLLPALYEEALPFSPTPAWAFSPTGADVVVVAGGGDDLDGASGSGTFPDPNAFVSGYAAWLGKIRAHYPQAFVVCALTAGAKTGDITTLGNAIQKAVAERQAAGDTKVAYFNFFMYDPQYTTYGDIATGLNLGYGCKYHPSPAGAAWLAQRLSRFIAEKMAWSL